MFGNVAVHERVCGRHPELRTVDVESAWRNALVVTERAGEGPNAVLVAVGFDANGRMLEMIADVGIDGTVLIYHAMTPPSAKTLREAGLAG